MTLRIKHVVLLMATPRDASPNTSPMAGESQTGAYVGMMHTF
jgi:hypothetical protein